MATAKRIVSGARPANRTLWKAVCSAMNSLAAGHEITTNLPDGPGCDVATRRRPCLRGDGRGLDAGSGSPGNGRGPHRPCALRNRIRYTKPEPLSRPARASRARLLTRPPSDAASPRRRPRRAPFPISEKPHVSLDVRSVTVCNSDALQASWIVIRAADPQRHQWSCPWTTMAAAACAHRPPAPAALMGRPGARSRCRLTSWRLSSVAPVTRHASRDARAFPVDGGPRTARVTRCVRTHTCHHVRHEP